MSFDTLHNKHIKLVENVNNSITEWDHTLNLLYLRAWRDGVEDSGRKLRLMDCDMLYIEKGVDRPMCCGVWLDWKPYDNAEAGRIGLARFDQESCCDQTGGKL